jgi:hypothetical protein
MRNSSRAEPTPRRARSDKGTVLLTGRDWDVLSWIAEQYAVRFDHVCLLLGQQAGDGAKVPDRISDNAARQVIARWQRGGWAAARKMLVAEPAWVWITAKGLHELGYDFKPYAPTLARIDHLHAINMIRLMLERDYPDAPWTSERQIRAKLSYEKGASLPHLPDGELRISQQTIAIEAELTPKKRTDVRLILIDLLRHYHEVWYFASSSAFSVVTGARKELEPQLSERIKIWHSANEHS